LPRTPSRIPAFRCTRGHLFVVQHASCPSCGLPLVATSIQARGTLLLHTTVRVTPSGEPLELGVVRTPAGATTLCRIRGRIRGNGRDAVELVVEEGRFVALGKGGRKANKPTP
jgi:uncharacterized OB-fold protein